MRYEFSETNYRKCSNNFAANCNKSFIAALCLDIKGAFGSVNPLTHKLNSLGIRGKTVHWINSFTQCRHIWFIGNASLHVLPSASEVSHKGASFPFSFLIVSSWHRWSPWIGRSHVGLCRWHRALRGWSWWRKTRRKLQNVLDCTVGNDCTHNWYDWIILWTITP